MRHHKLDNRKVICPNASLLAGGTRVLKAGMLFTYHSPSQGEMIARSLGHVTAGREGEIEAFDGIMAMVMASDHTFAFIRWIHPDEVTRIVESAHKLAAFFFAPEMPYDPQTMVDLIEYGTVCERYVDNAPARVAARRVG